jgi:hypothetical protein
VWLKEEGHKMRNQMLDELFSAEDYMYIWIKHYFYIKVSIMVREV